MNQEMLHCASASIPTYCLAVNVLSVPHLVDRDFAICIVNQMHDSIVSLAHAVTIRKARQFFRAAWTRILRERRNPLNNPALICLGTY